VQAMLQVPHDNSNDKHDRQQLAPAFDGHDFDLQLLLQEQSSQQNIDSQADTGTGKRRLR
jgi:hypothetical protein